MSDEAEWITLATTPPATLESFQKLTQALEDSKIDASVEQNLVRQCERDPAAWLKVHPSDLPLARQLAHRLLQEE